MWLEESRRALETRFSEPQLRTYTPQATCQLLHTSGLQWASTISNGKERKERRQLFIRMSRIIVFFKTTTKPEFRPYFLEWEKSRNTTHSEESGERKKGEIEEVDYSNSLICLLREGMIRAANPVLLRTSNSTGQSVGWLITSRTAAPVEAPQIRRRRTEKKTT